jgi:hypothetical protein
MAKKPGTGMDEEEIIRRRDDVAGAPPDKPIDSETKRALADARLRALAFALGSEQSRNTPADQTDDAELLAYLLDTLPEHRRRALEETLRGNARAFGRLMTLRAALDSQTDQRDRQRADDPARKIRRRTAGRVDIRRVGEILQFRDAARPRSSFGQERFARSEPKVFALADELSSRPPARVHLERDENTKRMLRNLLERSRRDLDAGMSLINEALSSLQIWSDVHRRAESETRGSGASANREAENLRERLKALLRELEIVANRIGDITSATDDMSPRAQIAESLSLETPSNADLYQAPLERRLPTGQERWVDAFDLEAGPWAIRLTGSAVTTPRLVVYLRGDQVGPWDDLFLTLVRPAEGFETVNLDSSGIGEIALPTGDSVMLLQADEIWEVRLSFRDFSRGAR